MPIDVNDPIIQSGKLSVSKNWIDRFGNYERSIILYNISMNRVRIEALEARLQAFTEPNIVDPNLPGDPIPKAQDAAGF